MDIHRDTRLLKTIASHKDAPIVFHHPFAIAIDVMQWQHHSHTDSTLANIVRGILSYGINSKGNCHKQQEISQKSRHKTLLFANYDAKLLNIYHLSFIIYHFFRIFAL